MTAPPSPGPTRRHFRRRVALLLALVLALAGALTWRALRAVRLPGKIQVVVTKVVDGDTLRCIPTGHMAGLAEQGRELKVRLCGINSAELGTAQSFRAALALAELAEGAGETWLEPERQRDGAVAHDKYGRVLGWLWVEPGSGWSRQRRLLTAGLPVDAPRANAEGLILVQEELLKLGLTQIYPAAKASRHYAWLEVASR
jgi:endonuclease YncB( thermonuclease family)